MDKKTKITLATFWLLFIAGCWWLISQTPFKLLDITEGLSSEGGYTLIWLALFALLMTVSIVVLGKRLKSLIGLLVVHIFIGAILIYVFFFIGFYTNIYVSEWIDIPLIPD